MISIIVIISYISNIFCSDTRILKVSFHNLINCCNYNTNKYNIKHLEFCEQHKKLRFQKIGPEKSFFHYEHFDCCRKCYSNLNYFLRFYSDYLDNFNFIEMKETIFLNKRDSVVPRRYFLSNGKSTDGSIWFLSIYNFKRFYLISFCDQRYYLHELEKIENDGLLKMKIISKPITIFKISNQKIKIFLIKSKDLLFEKVYSYDRDKNQKHRIEFESILKIIDLERSFLNRQKIVENLSKLSDIYDKKCFYNMGFEYDSELD